MSNRQETIEKLEASAASERKLGNNAAADRFAAKAASLRRKHNLSKPDAVKEPLPQDKTQSVCQPLWSHSDNFPGVPPQEAPLSNSQLSALRESSQAKGRPLTDAERDAVLGKKNQETGESPKWLFVD